MVQKRFDCLHMPTASPHFVDILQMTLPQFKCCWSHAPVSIRLWRYLLTYLLNRHYYSQAWM